MAKKNYKLEIDIEVNSALQKAKEDLAEMVKLRDKLNKDIDLVPDDAVKELTDILKVTEKTTKSIKERKNALTELQKVEVKLKQARSTEGKQLAEINVQLTEQRKRNREDAKQKLVQVGAYEKLSKKLLAQKKAVKDLLAENRKLSKSEKQLIKDTQKLDREVKQLDQTVGDHQREVGNYSKALEGASRKALGWAAALVGTGAAIAGVNKSMKANEEGSESLRKAQAQLGAATDVVANRFGKFFGTLIDLGKGLVTGKSTKSITDLTSSFDEMGKEIIKTADAADKAEDQQISLEKSSRALRIELERINGQLAIQSSIAGDTTRSFNEQQEAAEKLTRLQIERTVILNDLGLAELDILEKQLEARGKGANNLVLLTAIADKRI
jgi:chromosome segregation ATPase